MEVSGLLSSCTTPAAICPNVASLSACDHALLEGAAPPARRRSSERRGSARAQREGGPIEQVGRGRRVGLQLELVGSDVQRRARGTPGTGSDVLVRHAREDARRVEAGPPLRHPFGHADARPVAPRARATGSEATHAPMAYAGRIAATASTIGLDDGTLALRRAAGRAPRRAGGRASRWGPRRARARAATRPP